MAQWYKFVLYCLWIAPHTLLLAVAAIIYLRRSYKSFPVFFAYTIYENVVFLLLLVSYLIGNISGSLYRHIFISTLLGSTALRFGIIQEIFNNIFRDYPRLEVIATASMRCVTGLLLLAAILSVLYFSGAAPDVMVGVKLLDRSVTIIQVGLLLFLFLFSRLFGLSWRSFTFGIALGFALFSTSQIAAWTLSLRALTETSKSWVDLMPTGSYLLTVLLWLGYLLAVEKPVGVAAYTVPEIEHWNRELEQSR